jgi:serine O-acetyltransferase
MEGVRADHAAMRSSQAKYKGRPLEGSLTKDAVEKVGFQIMVAYRVMRFLVDVDVRLGSRILSRSMRHLYGSDVHWEAQFDPGVMLVHGMGMAISDGARVARGAILFQHCTLGEGRHPDTGAVGAPTVEEDVVVGAGATLIGPITIGARSKIMPGCVVVRSVPPDSIVESPAAVVRPRGRAREAS